MLSKAGMFKKGSRQKSYSKANPYFDGRYVRNNVGIEDDKSSGMGGLEWEYEERSFNDINNLGKYLVGIDISEWHLYDNIDKIKAYVDKYPHIEVTILKPSLYDRRSVVDVDKLYSDKHTSTKTKNQLEITEYLK